jgi:hypothetical protein
MTHQEYNLFIADLFDRVPLKAIDSPQGQAVIQYFVDKLTADKQPGELERELEA